MGTQTEDQASARQNLQVVAAIAGAAVLGTLAQWHLASERELSEGLALWAVALAVFAYGLALARGLRTETGSGSGEPPMWRTLPWLIEARLAVLVLGAGAFFRLYRIEDIPPGLNHDAAWNGLHAIKITQGIAYAPYVAAAWGRETMFHHVIAFWQLLLGPTQTAIEIAAVSVGVATLVAFYFLMRRLFDAPTAIVGASLLGVSGWHLTLSKVGWRVVLVPLFECLIFYFLYRAIQERRRLHFVLAGLALGLSLDTYDAARVLPFVVVAYVVFEVWREPALLRSQFAGFAVLVIAAVIAFSPLGWYALHHWEEFTGRGRFLWIGAQMERAGSAEPLFTNIKEALLIFNYRGNGDDFFVREPLLDLPLSVVFPLGLVLSVTRWRQPQHFLLLSLLALTLAVGVASTPNGNRNFGAVIPVVAFAAVFLVETWRWLMRQFPGRAREATALLVAVLFLASYATWDSYLGPDRRVQWGFYPETTRVGRYMKRIAPEYHIYAAAGNWPRDALTYLSYQGEGDPFVPVYEYTQNAADFLGVPMDGQKGTAFIIEAVPNNMEVVDALRKRFPSAKVEDIYYPDGSGKVIAHSILVSAGEIPLTDTGVPYVPPGAIERDQERREDLLRITAALLDYREREGAFPDTGGNPQTACAYKDLDRLCQLEEQLGADALTDPRGDPHKYGYWYSSDGESFVVYASFEGPLPPEEKCTPPDSEMAKTANLYCLGSD